MGPGLSHAVCIYHHTHCTFEDGESYILWNDDSEEVSELLADFLLQHRRLSEPSDQEDVLDV